jgi:hypothetical protein
MKFSAYDWRELLKLVAFLAVSVGYWAHKITKCAVKPRPLGRGYKAH